MYGTDQKITAYDDGSVVIGEGDEAIRYSKEQFQD
jgi:hypothetical protein